MAYKATISKLNTREKTSRSGNPYTSLGIAVEENTLEDKDENGNVIRSLQIGDNWLNGFKNDWNRHWQEGDRVSFDVDVVRKNGSTYYNLEEPEEDNQQPQPQQSTGSDSASSKDRGAQLDRIEKGIEELLKANQSIDTVAEGGPPSTPPVNEYEDDNGIPF